MTTKPTPIPQADPVADAEAMVAKLERQREKLARRQAEHDAERGRLAFAARAQGDVEAGRRLSEMADEAIRSEHAARDIEAALKTARARLEQAQRSSADAAVRCAAHKVRKLGNFARYGLMLAEQIGDAGGRCGFRISGLTGEQA